MSVCWARRNRRRKTSTSESDPAEASEADPWCAAGAQFLAVRLRLQSFPASRSGQSANPAHSIAIRGAAAGGDPRRIRLILDSTAAKPLRPAALMLSVNLAVQSCYTALSSTKPNNRSPMKIGLDMRKAITCFNCGRPFVAVINRRAPKLLTCSLECEAAVARKGRKGIAEQKQRLRLPELTCEGCRKAFRPKRKGATYCSPDCRQRTYRRRARDNSNQGATDRPRYFPS